MDRLCLGSRGWGAYPPVALTRQPTVNRSCGVVHQRKSARGVAVVNALAKAGIELGENGSIFPRPKGKAG